MTNNQQQQRREAAGHSWTRRLRPYQSQNRLTILQNGRSCLFVVFLIAVTVVSSNLRSIQSTVFLSDHSDSADFFLPLLQHNDNSSSSSSSSNTPARLAQLPDVSPIAGQDGAGHSINASAEQNRDETVIEGQTKLDNTLPTTTTTTTTTSSSTSSSKTIPSYPADDITKNRYVDTNTPYPKPLVNSVLLGKYSNANRTNDDPDSCPHVGDTLIEPHHMDAVVMASAPDPTLAMSIHNLYHIMGFRRFVFFINDADRHCQTILDLLPQHHPERPSLCFSHVAFYQHRNGTTVSFQDLEQHYPKLHRGSKRVRNGQAVNVTRVGWYLQQFTKLLVQDLVPDLSDEYLAVDGDLIFTKPLHFFNGSKTILPATKKSGHEWEPFVRDVVHGGNDKWFPDEERVCESLNVPCGPEETSFIPNFVIGWMVLHRNIVSELLDVINQRLPLDETPFVASSASSSPFPFNVLQWSEENFDSQKSFFSEFYTYAHFALRHPNNPYQVMEFPNKKGSFRGRIEKEGCTLKRHVYIRFQNDRMADPFMIWEEHKYHSMGTCPIVKNGDTSSALTTLSEVGMWHDFHPPPWGGGNQFLLALRYGIEHYHGIRVAAKSDPEGKIPIISDSSQVLLANSITFGGNDQLLQSRKTRHKLALVHRVDGPYYVARYARSLDAETFDLPEEDIRTKSINENFACATVFQSEWSYNANVRIGLTLRNPVLIPNTINPTIFHPANDDGDDDGDNSKSREWPPKDRKIKILASCHSNGSRKGFDTMQWVDEHLDFDRFEFVFMGGRPKGFSTQNITLRDEAPSEALGDVLRQADIYFAPSRLEPASNAVLEALASGLPVLYQEGSSHGELVGDGGVGFGSTGPELLTALDRLVANYTDHRRNIRIPTIEEVTHRYVSIMRWCMMMHRTLM